jgi:hypothetical protein
VNAQWQRFCHYDTIEQAIQKAYQLGMPYSTAFSELPHCVRDTFEERLLQVKGEMGLGNMIPQSNINPVPPKIPVSKSSRPKLSGRKMKYEDFHGMKAEDIESRTMSGYGHNVSKKRVCIQELKGNEGMYDRFEGFEIEPADSYSLGGQERQVKCKEGDIISIKQEFCEEDSKLNKEAEIMKKIDAITAKKVLSKCNTEKKAAIKPKTLSQKKDDELEDMRDLNKGVDCKNCVAKRNHISAAKQSPYARSISDRFKAVEIEANDF